MDNVVFILINSLCAIVIMFLIFNSRKNMVSERKNIFINTSICAFIMMVIDIVIRCLVENHTNGIIVPIFSSLYFIAFAYLAYCWFIYSEILQDINLKNNIKMRALMLIPVFIFSVFEILSISNEWFFYQENGMYYRGDYYIWQYIFILIYISFASIKVILKIIINKGFREEFEYLTIASFSVYPVIFILLRLLHSNSCFSEMGITLGLFQSYLYINSFEREKYKNYSKIVTFSKLFLNTYFIDLNTGEAEIVGSSLKEDSTILKSLYEKNLLNFYEMLPTYINQYVHEDDRLALFQYTSKDYISSNLSSENPYFSYIYRQVSNDKIKWYRMYIILKSTTFDGKANKILLTVMDVNKEIELDLSQKRQIEKALIEAQQANKAKSSFLSNMTHEIRTPMNAIIGYTTLAKMAFNSNETEKINDYLKKISSSSEHLLSIINNVLDMSKIESGKVSIDYKTGDLNVIIDDVVKITSSQMALKNHEFILNRDIINNKVIIDKVKFTQVLINIVANAIKYTQDNGTITFNIKEELLENTKSKFIFEVVDSGMGMSRDFLNSIFEPFERENTSTDSGIEGTGLGLPIAKNIVDLMGGKINVESEINNGTKITIDIDFAIVKEDLKEEETNDDEVINAATHNRILLVEDNELNREIAIELITANGYDVDYAVNGKEAIEILIAKKNRYDLVLMDVQMPIMNGHEASIIIRSLNDDYISKIPIIAMTANAFLEDRNEAFKSGMNDFISKPFKIKELITVIEKHIKK